MPLDTTPLLREIAQRSHSLTDLRTEAKRAGFHAYYTVVRLSRRHRKLGTRLHALVIHSGLKPEAVALDGEGLEKSDIEELSHILNLPVLVARDGHVELYSPA